MRESVLVVGGGLSGIVSAIFHAKSGTKVTLVENTSNLGGLLRSYTCSAGFSFDYGTHFLRQTGVDDIDEVLFNYLPDNDWKFYPYLKCGNFFGNQLNEGSPFISSNLIGQNDYAKGLSQFLDCNPEPTEYRNLSEQLVGTFGRTFYEKIHKPIVEKFYNCDPSVLETNAHLALGLNKITIESPEKTRQLKINKFNDQRLGFHSYKEGVSSLKSIYPRTGGIGKWIDFLEGLMKKKGVNLETNKSVDRLHVERGCVKSALLSSGHLIHVDKLIWTIPSWLFLKANHKNFVQKPIRFVGLRIYHFLSSKPPLCDVYYVTCNAPHFKTYRVTLHSNFNEESCFQFYPFTVEVISHDHCDPSTECVQTIDEAKLMRLFPSDAYIKCVNVEKVSNGFPIQELGYSRTLLDYIEDAEKVAHNVYFIGKATGKTFFMDQVIREAFQASYE